MKSEGMGEWCQLPMDLLTLIGKKLKTEFDKVRFRSVCSSWRNSLTPPPSPRLSILPNNGISHTSWGFFLSKRTILSLSSPTYPSQSWLIKIEQDNPLITHLINPLTSSQFHLPVVQSGTNIVDPTLIQNSIHLGVSESGSGNDNSTLTHVSSSGVDACRIPGSSSDQNLGIPGLGDLIQAVSGSGNDNPTETHVGLSRVDTPHIPASSSDHNLSLPRLGNSIQAVSGSRNDNPTETHVGFDINLGLTESCDSAQVGLSCGSSSKQGNSKLVRGLGNDDDVAETRVDSVLGFPKTLDLMPIRVIELGFEYILRYINYRPYASRISDAGNLYMEKVAVLLDSRIGYVLLTIHVSGKLVMFKIGDKKWTIILDFPSMYDDVVLFNERLYAVDNTGRAVVVGLDALNSFAPVVEVVADPIFGGDKKTMVVSGEELLLVDTFLSVGPEDDAGFEEEVEYYEEFDCYMSERTVRFKVFKLDWGGKKWDEVKDLGDRMLFLGDYCTFSAPASDFDGCNGNCIIFADRTFYSSRQEEEEDGSVKGRGVGVFNLETGSIGFLGTFPGYSKMFWPPPSWVYSSSTTLEDDLNHLEI